MLSVDSGEADLVNLEAEGSDLGTMGNSMTVS